MGASAEPWQTAEIAGPKKALIILKPEVVVALIKRAKRPILIVGHEAVDSDLGEEKLIDYTIRLAKTAKIPVVATAHIVGEFAKRGYLPAAWMPAVDIAGRLQDTEWKGLDGKGQYDLAVFTGLPYYMTFLVLSSLKHFSSNLKTITLDRFYQPHATWSFPNLSQKDWSENLNILLNKIRGK